MLKIITFAFLIAALNCNSQILRETFSPTDLIGVWEYQIPGSNEYIAFTFTEEFRTVTGEFKKYIKDANGNITNTLFDSSSDNVPNAVGDQAIKYPEYYPFDNNSVMHSFFIDDGITNTNSVNGRRIRLIQLATLKILRICDTCELQLEFSLIPKNPGINPYDQEYSINIPTTMVLNKI